MDKHEISPEGLGACLHNRRLNKNGANPGISVVRNIEVETKFPLFF